LGSSGSGVAGPGWDAIALEGVEHPVGEVRRQGQLGRPAHEQAALFGEEGVVGASQARLQRLGTFDAQGGPFGVAHVDPRQQKRQLVLRGGDLFLWRACYAVGLGDVAAHVPHPVAIGGRVRGHGEARFGAAAQAVGRTAVSGLGLWR
jgi:hypothetical protein